MANGRDHPLLDLFQWDQLSSAEGAEYLLKVKTSVLKNRKTTTCFDLKRRSGSGVKLRIAGIDDTIHSENTEEDDWGLFYLPQVVKMCVFAVVEDTTWWFNQLVLMTCENKKVYGYDGKELHEVASDLKELCDDGLEYPASSEGGQVEASRNGETTRPLRKQEKFLVVQEAFRTNAWKVIIFMLYWSKYTSTGKRLVDEILHSIFFLGGINTPKCEPKDIVGDDILNMLKDKYPGPLEFYSSQLPRRSPFSCVLDMIVLMEGQREKDKIKKRLKIMVGRLEKDFLVSTTMCVSTCKKNNYYGVSMSTKRMATARKIVIAASCLSFWHEYVAGAVMTYCLDKNGENEEEKYKKKPYFDGTIKLPLHLVTCQAFNIKNQNIMNPCRSCGILFGLPTTETNIVNWQYGNCAEAESVSKMLDKENNVEEAAKPTSPTYTENRKKAEDDVNMLLKQVLNMVNFTWVGDVFYKPQN